MSNCKGQKMTNQQHDNQESLEQKSEKHLLDFFSSFDPNGDFIEWKNKVMLEFWILRTKKFGSPLQTQTAIAQNVQQNSDSLDWRELDRR